MVRREFDGSPFEAVASYCRALRVDQLVVVSGTAAIGPDGQIMHPGDASAQLRVALERAIATAEKLGATREDVVCTRLYFVAAAGWEDAVKVHGEVFAGAEPANTTVLVAGLPPKGALVEVELQAWVRSPHE